MDELTRRDLIQSCIDRLELHTYLEIGIGDGANFKAVQAPRKMAVDPRIPLADRAGSAARAWVGDRRATYYRMPSDAFFSSVMPGLDLRLDIAFIDGMHTDEQAHRDVINCLEWVREGGIILLHDCNPASAAIALRAQGYDEAKAHNHPEWTSEWCGDVWKAIARLRCRPDLTVGVFDSDYGLGFVEARPNPAPLQLSDVEIDQMTYADLDARRTELLGLRPAADAKDWLAQRA